MYISLSFLVSFLECNDRSCFGHLIFEVCQRCVSSDYEQHNPHSVPFIQASSKCRSFACHFELEWQKHCANSKMFQPLRRQGTAVIWRGALLSVCFGIGFVITAKGCPATWRFRMNLAVLRPNAVDGKEDHRVLHAGNGFKSSTSTRSGMLGEAYRWQGHENGRFGEVT